MARLCGRAVRLTAQNGGLPTPRAAACLVHCSLVQKVTGPRFAVLNGLPARPGQLLTPVVLARVRLALRCRSARFGLTVFNGLQLGFLGLEHLSCRAWFLGLKNCIGLS
jgi:hypothetical protein